MHINGLFDATGDSKSLDVGGAQRAGTNPLFSATLAKLTSDRQQASEATRLQRNATPPATTGSTTASVALNTSTTGTITAVPNADSPFTQQVKLFETQFVGNATQSQITDPVTLQQPAKLQQRRAIGNALAPTSTRPINLTVQGFAVCHTPLTPSPAAWPGCVSLEKRYNGCPL